MDDDIQRLLDGQRHAEAFGLLAGRYKDKVFRLAYAMLRDESQAEDAAQEALVKIWKALPGYVRMASLSTWIYAITRNTCLSELRKRAARPTVSLEDPAVEAVPALQTAD